MLASPSRRRCGSSNRWRLCPLNQKVVRPPDARQTCQGVFVVLGLPRQRFFQSGLSRVRSERHAPCCYFFMVIAIIVTSWVGFSTIICLAFARVAARPRPLVDDNVQQVGDDVPVVCDNVSLVGDNVTAEVETPRRQTRTPEAVCAS